MAYDSGLSDSTLTGGAVGAPQDDWFSTNAPPDSTATGTTAPAPTAGSGFGSLNFQAPAPTTSLDFQAPTPAGSLNFAPPTLEDARNSPGYQFALEQGMKGIQNSAAARGTLLTGGTLKALQGYGTGLADQTYGNIFNRALQTQQMANGSYADAFNRALQTSQFNNTAYNDTFNRALLTNQTNFNDQYKLAQLGQQSANA